MDIKENVLAKINKEALDKLLLIDNKVGSTSINSNDVINYITNYKLMDKIGVRFSVVCDGNLESIINLLLNYYENINYIYLNHRNLGVVLYIVDIINELYKVSIDVSENNLDESYLCNNVIISGKDEFIAKYKLVLTSKNILIYK